MIASFNGHVDVVRVLITVAHADIHSQDKVVCSRTMVHIKWYVPVNFNVQNGFTALHMSSQDGQVDVVHLLLEANVHVNQRSKVSIVNTGIFCSYELLGHCSNCYSRVLHMAVQSLRDI